MNFIERIACYGKQMRNRNKSQSTISMTFCAPEYNVNEMTMLKNIGCDILSFTQAKSVSLSQNTQIFEEVHEYIELTLKRYFVGEVLEQAISIFEDFAHGKIGNIDCEIIDTPENLTSKDMMHFCWNIWNRVRPVSRMSAARFLKRAMPKLFESICAKSIYYKMTNDDGLFTIPIIKSGPLIAEVTVNE